MAPPLPFWGARLTVKRSDLDSYVRYADLLFNADTGGQKGSSYGFIEYSTNLQENNPSQVPDISIPYGFENVYYKRKKGYDLERIKILKEIKKKENKIYLRNLNLTSLNDIYEIFEHEIYIQNNYGAVLENASGERITVKRGRYSLEPGARASYIQKRVKKELRPIKQVIMLSLSIYQPEVRAVMPKNTNLLPVEYAIIHCWEWLNSFLKRLRDYMKRNNLPWGYIGTVLEFQDEYDINGFPHLHVLFENRWLGPIIEIAKLWPYCPPHGVDFMTKGRWEKENPGKKYTPLRLAKYLSKYLSKSQFYDKDKGVHKCHAIASYYGVRMFNFAHEYRAIKGIEKRSDNTWKYVGVECA